MLNQTKSLNERRSRGGRWGTITLTLAAFAFTPLIPSSAAAQSESERLAKLEKAVELLQQRNAELEREVSTLKRQKSSAATTLRPDQRSKFVPDTKSYVEKSETTEEKKPVYVVPGASEIKLVLGGFLQTQYEGGDVFAFEGRFGSGALDDRFRIRRARISITGDFVDQFDFKLEGEYAQSDLGLTVRDATGKTLASNSTRTGFGGLDLWANWHRFPEFQIKVGQYKAPFGLEQLSPDPKLFTLERSEVTSALTPERQVGVQVWGKPLATILPEQKDLLTYYAGIFNGNGRNISVNDNDEYMYVGRLEVQALKAKIFNQDATVRFGANGLTSRDAAGTVLSPAGTLRVNSDGSLSSFTAPSAAEREGYGFDASFHFGPLDVIAEYLSESYEGRTVNGVPPTFQDFRAEGYYVQGSYFIIPKKLQLFTKYESFNPGQVADDNLMSITGGLNYYIHGDDLKLMAHYIHTWSNFRESRPALGSDEFDEFILRLQVMY
ncbi:MAG: phosphate-selective porin OprO and OprP [Verrucomicrobiota bacterium]|jgi:phosphate-selective porin/cell division protein FtsB